MLLIGMGVLLQVRDVPESVHRTFKARAAAAGSSLSEYMRTILTKAATRPTPEELTARIRARGSVKRDEPSQDSVRHLRTHGE